MQRESALNYVGSTSAFFMRIEGREHGKGERWGNAHARTQASEVHGRISQILRLFVCRAAFS